MRAFLLLSLPALLAGCADPAYFTDRATAAVQDSGPGGSSDYIGPEGGYYAGEPVVFAHSADFLYKVDPETLKVSEVGAFKWPGGGSDMMTDIALDRGGKMIGISYSTVYSVNTKTAACTRLADLPTSFATDGYNGLSFIFSEIADGREALWAASQDGTVAEVNPSTGASKQVGSYHGPGSSGDVVSVKGLGTLATVKKSPGLGGNDWLARVNTLNGQAVPIGDTGFADIWGLGFWKNKVYGFTNSGEFVLIDPKSGKGTRVTTGGPTFWGAGVTTAAPVID